MITFLFGDYWKEILISQGYPENRLLVVGQIKTDIIPDLLSLNQNRILQKLQSYLLHNQKRLVLRKMVLVDLLKYVKKLI